MTWPSEEIPEADHVFMRGHKMHLDADGQFKPSVFKDQGPSMSTNWEKYCASADDCRSRAKDPTANGVLRGHVGSIRENARLTVTHTPVQETEAKPDRSHTCVIGPKTEAVRLKLQEIFETVLPVGAPAPQ
jgi:hypothetical protein